MGKPPGSTNCLWVWLETVLRLLNSFEGLNSISCRLSNNALLQGALDIKYLQTREAKGKAWIETFMAKHHRVVDMPLMQAQADILQWERGELGGPGFFDCTVCVRLHMSLHGPVSNALHIEGDIDGAGCFFVAKSPL